MLPNLLTRNSKLSPQLKAAVEIERRRRRKKQEKVLDRKRLRWQADPALYAKERLGILLTDSQKQIVYSIRDNRRTAVKAHHSLGKTFVVAIALLWWIDCWKSHIGYITAPTWGQALDLTFKQAKRFVMIHKMEFEILNSGWIRDRDPFVQTERFIKALNAKTGEGFQGEHTAPILIVKEEAVGIPTYIDDAAEGLMTDSRCRIIEIGNPTDESTNFGEHCDSEKYEVFSFSAMDHPNMETDLKCKPPKFPGAVRLQWVYEQMIDECDVVEHGVDDAFEFYTMDSLLKCIDGKPITKKTPKVWYKPTAFFQGRVLGEFPTEASDKVIPSGWIKYQPVHNIDKRFRIEIGCDVARFGDDRTTVVARIGAVVLVLRELRKFDSYAISNAIKEVIRDAYMVIHGVRLKYEHIPRANASIKIDTTGGLGTGPYDNLNHEGYQVVAINSSEKANNDEFYINKRSELWFDLRDRVRDKRFDMSRLPDMMQRKIRKELSTPMYQVRKGKKVVEEKSESKKRLGASPDIADGVNLAFYTPLTQSSEIAYGLPHQSIYGR